MAESALSMDLGSCLTLLVTCSLFYFLIQFVRLIMADSDLTLQWAAYFGHTPESKLGGNVIWVTGASSGIGEELSYQLAKLGCPLILSSRRENELLRVKQKCLEMSNLEDKDILVLPLDMTQMSMHKDATDKALQHFGRIDILVNNAGRSQRSLYVETNLDVFRALIELNYLGTISITKHVLPHMIQRKRGRIINISSVAGLIGAPLSTGYCASKHALQGFFNSLRTELTTYPDIIISNICPGPVQSKIVENAITEECDKVSSIKTDQSHKMATSRCAQLILITAANNLKETWISAQPILIIYYLWQYIPTLAWWITAKVGERRIKNFKSGVDADSSYFTKKSR
ncbi:dehydrogenase/reductase (SDR family) member 7 L homeolog [Xenopus laevis]|uniref:Dehydrogenase/reductase (SDR family) member 7 L homeolog n=2 Tax=Xenopus laevis TaxID=8355 RepID=A0A8J0PWC8_XENLA|nr:dehydrogenase/reductase (SDR family) member 7 L homeolog [Xenopus laevis]